MIFLLGTIIKGGAIVMNAGYTIKKWNGKHRNDAIFVVLDNKTEKQCLYAPNKKADIAWVKDNLVAEHKEWADFGNEQVESLDDILF